VTGIPAPTLWVTVQKASNWSSTRSRCCRLDTQGRPVLLLEQDRARRDHTLIASGLAALARSDALAGARGPYTLQAALAACHTCAPSAADTDWSQIVALYDALAALAASPIIELNRAIAIGMAFGPQAALEIVERLEREQLLPGYPWRPSVRGDLLHKLGRSAEAQAAFRQAAAMTGNAQESELLLRRVQP
jgi:predicted RNA polymerase sigma factor